MNNHHISKRKRQAILFFSYGFMTLATIVITVVCLLLVLGYQFNIRAGKLEQGGLLQFRSIPAGATVTVDDVTQGFVTPGKLEVSAGIHTVEMSKAKYQTWQKSVRIPAGQLRWLDYTRLVPSKIVTTTIRPAEGVIAALPTPDKTTMVALTAQSPRSLELYDIRDTTKVGVKTLVITDSLLTLQPDQPSGLSLIEWDRDSRYLLLAHVSGANTEYLRIDRTASDGAVRNISKEFNLPFRGMHFSGNNANVLYAMTDRDIRRVDMAATSVSRPLVSDVESYSIYGDSTLAYVATRSESKIAGIYSGDKETIVRRFASTEPVMVDVAEYFHHRYVVVVSRSMVRVVIDPSGTTASTKDFVSYTLPYEAAWLGFSDNGRMIVAGNGRAFTSYDLETRDVTQVNPAEAGTVARPAWLDNYYLIDNPTGTIRLYEYDGTNSHSITAANSELPVFLSSNGTYLFSFGTQENKTVLQSTQMIVN